MRDTTFKYGRCLAAANIAKITPPENIYHRMWGAALHDRAEGIHQPLECNALWLRAIDSEAQLLILSIDHCLFWKDANDQLKQTVSNATGVAQEDIVVYFTHTHGAGLMDLGRDELPGGDLIAPYLDQIGQKIAAACSVLPSQLEEAWLTAGTGASSLATNRDFYDVQREGYVCGFNPLNTADQTLLTIKIARASGELLGVISNYACHPTTLAWENKLVSPDYIGSMRKTMRHALGRVPILFIQGASGDVGPREGYVGDVRVAERNGRQLGLANLEVLASMPDQPQRYSYDGAVISGATIGVWSYKPFDENEISDLSQFGTATRNVPLAYREDLGTLESVTGRIAELDAESSSPDASQWTDLQQRDHRALVERARRKLTRLSTLESYEAFEYPIRIWTLGEIVLLGLNGELYNCYQTKVREAVSDRAVMVGTLADGSDCWYLLDQSSYGKGLYQEEASIIGQGGLEVLIAESIKALNLG
ncbi:MAG: hypothetical protein CMJ79_04925 [Planctomycetaceae bacterium]|nr:hypothetical protein [Planctomycetaceae bacterium]